ncbi:MAG: hypothetical protein KDG49_21180 [Geminicoccaceae bacterium]|jgi:hypothetical protein|nr:hypothetical protein [Geminicoccaceae bacterium]
MQGHAQRPDTRPIEDPAETSKITLAKPGASTHEATGGRTRVLAEADHHAKEFHATREAIADLKRRRDIASAEARPLNGLRTACAEHLRGRGWRET